jgi:hypothetical protein
LDLLGGVGGLGAHDLLGGEDHALGKVVVEVSRVPDGNVYVLQQDGVARDN